MPPRSDSPDRRRKPLLRDKKAKPVPLPVSLGPSPIVAPPKPQKKAAPIPTKKRATQDKRHKEDLRAQRDAAEYAATVAGPFVPPALAPKHPKPPVPAPYKKGAQVDVHEADKLAIRKAISAPVFPALNPHQKEKLGPLAPTKIVAVPEPDYRTTQEKEFAKLGSGGKGGGSFFQALKDSLDEISAHDITAAKGIATGVAGEVEKVYEWNNRMAALAHNAKSWKERALIERQMMEDITDVATGGKALGNALFHGQTSAPGSAALGLAAIVPVGRIANLGERAVRGSLVFRQVLRDTGDLRQAAVAYEGAAKIPMRTFKYGELEMPLLPARSVSGRAAERFLDANRERLQSVPLLNKIVKSERAKLGTLVMQHGATVQAAEGSKVFTLEQLHHKMMGAFGRKGVQARTLERAFKLVIDGTTPMESMRFHAEEAAKAASKGFITAERMHNYQKNLSQRAAKYMTVSPEGKPLLDVSKLRPKAAFYANEALKYLVSMGKDREAIAIQFNLLNDAQIATRIAATNRIVHGARYEEYETTFRRLLDESPTRQLWMQKMEEEWKRTGTKPSVMSSLVSAMDTQARSIGLMLGDLKAGVDAIYLKDLHIQFGIPADVLDAAVSEKRVTTTGIIPKSNGTAIDDVPEDLQSLAQEMLWTESDEGSAHFLGIADEMLAAHPARTVKGEARSILPPHVKTREEMADLIKGLRQRAIQGEAYRKWYTYSAREVLGFVNGNKHEAVKIARLLAIYSPQAAVWDSSTWNNVTRALAAYREHRAGQPVSEVWSISRKSKRDWQTLEAERALSEDFYDKIGTGSAPKINAFMQNMIEEIDPVLYAKLWPDASQRTTQDKWMGIAFGYGRNPDKYEYEFMHNLTSRIGENIGWQPKEVQAAIWTSIKAEVERTPLSTAGVDFGDALRTYQKQQRMYIQAEKIKKGIDFEPRPFDAPNLEPLAGLPPKGVEEGGPLLELRALAHDYSELSGIPHHPPAKFRTPVESFHRKVAAWFGDAIHDPHAPDVMRSFGALKSEAKDQFDFLVAHGYTFEFYPKGETPYPSPWDSVRDIRDNKHMYVYPTFEGYGMEFEAAGTADHPMLEFVPGLSWGDQRVTYNDVFRAVHDVFGHSMEMVGFRFDGEENAALQHMAMFSREARPAMITETRGQNSWVNFGPFGERNRTADQATTVYAEQKAIIAPPWVVEGPYKEPYDARFEWKKIVKKTANLYGLTGNKRTDFEGTEKLLHDLIERNPDDPYYGKLANLAHEAWQAEQSPSPELLFASWEKDTPGPWNDPWGGIERRQVERPSSDDIYRGVYDVLQGSGGHTFLPDLTTDEAKHGFLTGILGTERAVPVGEMNGTQLIEFRRSVSQFVKDRPGTRIGLWRDGDTVYMDVSKVLGTEEEAMAFARENGQLAFYDRANKKNIRTGLTQAEHDAIHANVKPPEALASMSEWPENYHEKTGHLIDMLNILIEEQAGPSEMRMMREELFSHMLDRAALLGIAPKELWKGNFFDAELWDIQRAATKADNHYRAGYAEGSTPIEPVEGAAAPERPVDLPLPVLHPGVPPLAAASHEARIGRYGMYEGTHPDIITAMNNAARDSTHLPAQDSANQINAAGVSAAVKVEDFKTAQVLHNAIVEGSPMSKRAASDIFEGVLLGRRDGRRYKGLAVAMNTDSPLGKRAIYFTDLATPNTIIHELLHATIAGLPEETRLPLMWEAMVVRDTPTSYSFRDYKDSAGKVVKNDMTIKHDSGRKMWVLRRADRELAVEKNVKDLLQPAWNNLTPGSGGEWEAAHEQMARWAESFFLSDRQIPGFQKHMNTLRKAFREDLNAAEVVDMPKPVAKALDNLYRKGATPREGGRIVGAEDIPNFAEGYLPHVRGLPGGHVNRARTAFAGFMRGWGKIQERPGAALVANLPRDASIDNQLTGRLMISGEQATDIMRQASASMTKMLHIQAVWRNREMLLKVAQDLPEGKDWIPIVVDLKKGAKSRNAALNAFINREGYSADGLTQLGAGDMETFFRAHFPAKVEINGVERKVEDVAQEMIDENLKPIPNIRWVARDFWDDGAFERPRDAFKEAAKMLEGGVGTGLLKTYDQVRQFMVGTILYLNPSYVPLNLFNNGVMNFMQQGFAAPRNLYSATTVHRASTLEQRTFIDHVMGIGFTGAWNQPGISPNHIIRTMLAEPIGKVVDLMPRRASFFYEARRFGYRKDEDILALVQRAIDGDAVAQHEITLIKTKARDAIVVYDELSPLERNFVSRIIIFYPWLKGSSRYMIRFALEHPVQSVAMALILDHAMHAADQQIGPRPDYAQFVAPLSTKAIGVHIPFTNIGTSLGDKLLGDHAWTTADGLPMAINFRQAFTQTSPIELFNAGYGFVTGGTVASPGTGAGEQAIQLLNPLLYRGIISLSGYDPFTKKQVEPGLSRLLGGFTDIPLVTKFKMLTKMTSQSGKLQPRTRNQLWAQAFFSSLAPAAFDPTIAQLRAHEGNPEWNLQYKAKQVGLPPPPPQVIAQVEVDRRLKSAVHGIDAQDYKDKLLKSLEVADDMNGTHYVAQYKAQEANVTQARAKDLLSSLRASLLPLLRLYENEISRRRDANLNASK